MSRTLYDKLWDDHVVYSEEDGTATIYIDRQLLHEVTSPQAFEGLRQAKRPLWRKSSIVATADHNTPTTGWEQGYDGITDPISKEQVTTLDDNIKAFAEANHLPVTTAFRNQDLIDNRHPNYVGDLGIGVNPPLGKRIRESDLIIAIRT